MPFNPNSLEEQFGKLCDIYQGFNNFVMDDGTMLTPLQFAAKTAGVDVCQCFIALGGNEYSKCFNCRASLMHYAAMNKEHGLQLIDYFQSLGIKVDDQDKFGDKPIHYALKEGNFAIAEDLLKRQDPIEAKKDQCTLLTFCVKENRLDLAKIVYEHDKSTPEKYVLRTAARWAGLEMCKWLLYQEELENKDDRCKMLHYAALNEQHGADIISFLGRKMGYDVNAKHEKKTPLQFALQAENIRHAIRLISLKADIATKDAKNQGNLLHFCIQHNKLQSAMLMHLRNKELLDELYEGEKNCLHLAAESADLPMCQWLIEKCGLCPHVLSKEWYASALHFAARNRKHGEDIISYLRSLGLDLDEEDKSGHTPLHYAIWNGNVATVQHLLSLGADVNVKQGDLNLLYHSILEKNIEICKILHEKCPVLVKEIFYQGDNVLHFAAFHGNVQICAWLINKCGMDVFELSPVESWSVLHFSSYNKEPVTEYFASIFGQDLDGRDGNGWTALHHALNEENINAAKELVAHGASLKVKLDNEDNLLHFCVRRNKLSSFDFVLTMHPVLIGEITRDGESVVRLAAEHAGAEMLQYLLEKGLSEDYIVGEHFSLLDAVSQIQDYEDLENMGFSQEHFR